jgi:hypothetical protein
VPAVCEGVRARERHDEETSFSCPPPAIDRPILVIELPVYTHLYSVKTYNLPPFSIVWSLDDKETNKTPLIAV